VDLTVISCSGLVHVNWYTLFMQRKNTVVIIRKMFGATIQNLFDPTARGRRLTHSWLNCTMIITLNAVYRPTYFGELMFYEQNHFLSSSKERSEILQRSVSIISHYIFRQQLNIFDSNSGVLYCLWLH